MNKQKNLYVALLRGINVGGKNPIKMLELKACFESLGFTDVRTYINSGNVLFSTSEKNIEVMAQQIEKALTQTFTHKIPVVIISAKELQETVEGALVGFGKKPDEYRYDVIFLKPPLTPKEALKDISIKEGVDEVIAGKYVIYFSRLIAKATQSRLSRIVMLPIYQSMTIRNWNTTTKLLALMER